MPKRQHKEFYEVSKEEAKYMNSTNNNNQQNDHFTLERVHNTSETFNYEYRFDSVACNAFVNLRTDRLVGVNRVRTPIIDQPAYENLKFDLNLNKKLLLHKYFRSTEQNYAIYENLCRGCGYGVFEARGQLCNFCECIVQGVETRRGAIAASETSVSNIYENICDKCSAVYSSEVCESCCAKTNAVHERECNDKAKESREELVVPVDAADKLSKSKSFNKRDKRSIFHGLIGSLKRRAKTPQTSTSSTPATPSPSGARKRLEIIHNVDGYDNVFRTQETFDLQRICELKRSQTSCSDQHIYGRLKSSPEEEQISKTLPSQLSQSHSQLLEATVIADAGLNSGEKHSKKTGNASKKRPRISRPRLLLRSRSQNTSASNTTLESEQPQTPVVTKQSLYLADSVCHWMTSLRRETHNYRSFGLNIDDENIALCNPKSIPAKNTPIYYASVSSSGGVYEAPTTIVTNCQNIEVSAIVKNFYNNTPACRISDVSSNSSNSTSSCDETNVVTLRHSANNRYIQCDSREQQHESQEQKSPVARMVHEFKRSLLAKQMHEPQRNDAKAALACTTPLPELLASAAQHRSKRQAIYLKIDDDNNSSSQSHHYETDENSNDANVNYARKQTSETKPQLNETIAVAAAASISQHTTADSQGLASRRAARQAITTSGKRCGIYERDSEFVNDILCAFDTFLQREIETAENKLDEPQKATKPAEVIGDRNCKTSGNENRGALTEQQSKGYQCNEGNVATEAEVIDDNDDSDRGAEAIILDPRSTSVSVVAAATTAAATSQLVICGNSCLTLMQPFVDIKQIFDVVELIDHLLLSRSLNSVVIYYDKSLRVFLCNIYNRSCYRVKYAHWSHRCLVNKYRRFNDFFESTLTTEQSMKLSLDKGAGVKNNSECSHDSVLKVLQSDRTGDIKERNSVKIVVKLMQSSEDSEEDVKINESFETVSTAKSEVLKNSLKAFVDSERPSAKDNRMENVDSSRVVEISNSKLLRAEVKALSSSANSQYQHPDKNTSVSPKNLNRPQVPARDPKTTLTSANTHSTATNSDSPPLPAKRESPPRINSTANKMTVPTANSKPTQTTCTANINNNNNNFESKPDLEMRKTNNDEEDIYQPIWKFKTVGEVQERYHTDADYFELGDNTTAAKSSLLANDSSLLESSLISHDVDDHGEWETDDEFMFQTQMECDAAVANAADSYSLNSSTVRSTRSNSSATGSTVTGFGSSTATLASAISASLTHHLFRNIGIFYSLAEPKLRAIIFDYDRVHSAEYFAKKTPPLPVEAVSGSWADGGGSFYNANDSGDFGNVPTERSPIPPPRTTSTNNHFPGGESGCQSVAAAKVATAARQPSVLPDSVQAWKFMLLDVNYLEDEEDMIVSETEILRAQEIKEDNDTRSTPQLNVLQRFKSASIGNLIDLPNEDDKKSIAERMRNKLQRGVFKLNVRSPKSEKKSRGIFRRAEATSLYLEDGMKPKYPIFGAPLDQLELNQSTQPNVPRFVVDCVEYIERKDCIIQDGLYRASGNKVSIDELKLKLSESYIYDPKLLVADDLHTLSSLLKMFFRELGAPLVMQETYERLGRNLTDPAALETMRLAFDEMREPNRSTLKFLIKHLTNVAACSSANRMPASNLAIVWGPCLLSVDQIQFDIGRANTLAKVLIENYDKIFINENERLVC